MHRYKPGKALGEGAFGTVQQAIHLESGEEVAIKTLKDSCKNVESMMLLPEVKALRILSHPNIVRCRELVLDKNGYVHMIFEMLSGGNLETLARKRSKPFTEAQIRSVFYQLLCATRYMHSLNFLHRDIKPENILIESSSFEKEIHVKLADLGLAKHCSPSKVRPHTTYVATRWYRSPELLLRISSYGFPSDLWAIGAVMTELINLGEPLFPGSDELDQLSRIVALRGHPSTVGWRRGERAMERRRIKLPKVIPSSLQQIVPRATLPVIQLLTALLDLDPRRRPSAAEALNYPLFLAYSSPKHDDYRFANSLQGKSVQRETVRTRAFPSSRWSEGTDTDQIGKSAVAMEASSGSSTKRVRCLLQEKTSHSFVAARDTDCIGSRRFKIPKLSSQIPLVCAQHSVTERLRSPAGHFDMRTFRRR